MRVKKGDWIRTKDGLIREVESLYYWFGYAIDKEEDGSYNDTEGIVVDVAYEPRLLIQTGDLVADWDGYVVEVFVEKDTNDLYTYISGLYILRKCITKIWTKNDDGNYILRWKKVI